MPCIEISDVALCIVGFQFVVLNFRKEKKRRMDLKEGEYVEAPVSTSPGQPPQFAVGIIRRIVKPADGTGSVLAHVDFGSGVVASSNHRPDSPRGGEGVLVWRDVASLKRITAAGVVEQPN